MGRRIVVAAWAAEGATGAACLALVAARMATVHERIQLLAAFTVAAALGAGVLAALARRDAPAAVPLTLTVVVAGATRADNARVAVAAFAVAAVAPAVALAVAGVRARGALAIVAVLVVAARLVMRDPFRELHCQPFCDANPFLLERHHDVVSASEWLLVGTSALVLAWHARRAWAIGAAASAAWLAAAISTLHLAVQPRPIPNSRFDIAVDGLLLAVVGVSAAAQGATAWATLTARRQMRVFGRTVAEAHDVAAIQASLRRATADTELVIGLGADPPGPSDPTQVTTSVVRNGQTVAVIGHRPDSRARVADAITPSVALALETQVLLEQAQHLVDDVNRSRADAARSTDAARRALERDLHDGAQQHLLVAGMTLGEAASRAAYGDDRYRAAAADLAEALHELRRIGRGDAAAVAELGLADAASALAGRSPVAVASVVERCGAASHECWPVGTATAAYRLLVQTVSEAASSGASGVEFAARCLGPGRGREVEITHDGRAGTDREIDRDRVLAAGGTVQFGGEPGRQAATAWLP